MSLQKGLVGHWTLSTLKDSSAYDNHGTANGATKTTGLWNGAYDFEADNNDYINLGVVGDEFAIGTGDYTFSVWANFESITSNSTIFELSRYTDALLIRPDNNGPQLQIYMDNNATDRYFGPNIEGTTGKWYHFVVRRTGDTVEVFEDNTSIGTNSGMDGTFEITQDSYIGMSVHSTGQNHDGKLQDMRFYNRALSESEISALYNMRSQRQKNVKPYQLRPRAGSGPNLMDATSWTVGTDGSQGKFDRNGAVDENSIIEEDTPYGDLAPIWYGRSESTDDGSDGGWNWYALSPSDIDRDKTYRYSVWMKQEYTSGSFYHGTENVEDSNGNFQSNPYYANGDLPTMNDWYLLVGFNHPRNASKSLNESAIYDIDGNKVQDIQDFWWEDNDTDFGSQGMRWRSYYYYDTNVGRGVRFYDPRLEIMEDAHTPLSAMFNAARDFSDGRDRIWFDGFEGGNLVPQWSRNNGNANITSNQQFSGTYSYGSWGDGTIDTTWEPYDSQHRLSEFEYWWIEDSSQTGHVVALNDVNGNVVQESGNENPQWYLNNGSGGREQINSTSGTNYNVWTRFYFDFDWNNAQYDYVCEKTDGTHTTSGTQPLENTNPIDYIRFADGSSLNLYGSANYVRFDDITVRK